MTGKQIPTRLLLAVAGVVMWLLFYVTRAHEIGWTDTGELMAVAANLGIAHPTGYPLLTILARCVVMLPSSARVLTHLNLLSATLVVLASLCFAVVLLRLFAQRSKKIDRSSERVFSAVWASTLFATSSVVWNQATSYEVYALHILLGLGILYSFIRSVDEQSPAHGVVSRWWFAFAWCVGLGFANHMTTILLAPGLLLLYFWSQGWSLTALKRLLVISPFFFGALSLYGVLYVRAHDLPVLNWGNPSTMDNLLRHISGRQYQVWMFSGGDSVARQLSHFVGNIGDEIVYPALAIALAGFIHLFRTWKWMWTGATMIFLSTLVYGANFDIHEIGPYFLFAYLALCIFAGFGILSLLQYPWATKIAKPIIYAIAVASIFWQIIGHWKIIESENAGTPERFARTVLSEVDSGAVVVTSRWDYIYSPALYLQRVENMRPDVHLIDFSLLRDRVWYVEQVQGWLGPEIPFPGDKFEGFLVELRKFERGEPFAFQVIQMRWVELVTSLLEALDERGPLYIDNRLLDELPRTYSVMPSGLLVRISHNPGDLRNLGFSLKFEPIGNETPYLADLRQYLSTASISHAITELSSGRIQRADSLASLAARLWQANPTLPAYTASRERTTR